MAGLWVKLLTARLWLKPFDKARNLDSLYQETEKSKQVCVLFSEETMTVPVWIQQL